MKHALLPESLEGFTVGGMMEGEAAYTMPWAMRADGARRLWLNLRYPIDTRPGGTVAMRIERRRDGFHVWAVPGYAYGISDQEPRDEAPVVELHGATVQ